MTYENSAKYLKLCNWARDRYTDRVTGRLTLSVGGRPSIYTRIEAAAFCRYRGF